MRQYHVSRRGDPETEGRKREGGRKRLRDAVWWRQAPSDVSVGRVVRGGVAVVWRALNLALP